MDQLSSAHVETPLAAPTDAFEVEPVVAAAVVTRPELSAATAAAEPAQTPATAAAAASGAQAGALPEPSMAADASEIKPTTREPTTEARTKPSKASAGMNGGRWTEQEHQSFLAGLRLYGREWKKVASKIRTRTSAQIRSHAQKYFAKLARDDELRRLGGAAAGALLAHASAAHPDGLLAPSLYGYFSDGGSSAAPNSGDEDAADADARPASDAAPHRHGQRRPQHKRLAPAPPTAARSACVPSAAAMAYHPAALGLGSGAKKRSRSRSPSDSPDARAPNGAKQRRLTAAKPVALERLPSQEELIEKASPNVRRRLSSLIEAELCALQVLSCYAMLQQHSQRQSAAGRSPRFPPPPAPIGLAMLSTEQLPPASSIY